VKTRWTVLALLGAALGAQVPSGAPLATIDLATPAGAQSVSGAWRFHEAHPVEVAFRGPGPDRKPSGASNRTLDIEPKAGGVDFDDSQWEVIAADTLDQRRASGRICFCWYRLAVTLPDIAAGKTVVFEIVVDDYAEVWVDGRLPRQLGQRGGSLVAGWNVPNRVVIARDARPGQRVQLAVFGINGPISDPPPNFIWVRSAKLELYPTPRVIERLDPRIDALVPVGASIEEIASGLQWVEGPAWHRDGYLVFSDIPDNVIWRWTELEGRREYLRPSGYTAEAPFAGREPGSNGLAFDRAGRLLRCEHGDRRITARAPDGTVTVLAERYRGKRLNSPNDLVLARNGDLYFTDPPYGLPQTFADPGRELDFSGVYRLSTDGALTLLIDDLRGPNGIALSPDERTLYVSNADAARPVWLAYELRSDGTLGASRVLADASEWMKTRPGGPDGIDVDAAGNLFTAGPGGIYVFAPDGAHLGTLLTGSATSNCAFGGDGGDLYVTAGAAVLRVRLATRGLAFE
jgi:gluconolactonase